MSTRTGTGVRVRGRESGGHEEHERLGSAQLGAEPGERASLVQFSSAFCQPCRATRRILAEVAELVDGVAHIEVDAERNLALVRALGIEKTPTVLVLDGAGRIVRRGVGMPRKADVIAALGAAVDAG
ncbi:thioredoxin family protein [Streptomyces goshikiensis]|uniref:thioredoxin family protein n=1 Tax=Streptomyces goshikiensis TaxID=1942 RepID=UPI0036C84E5A